MQRAQATPERETEREREREREGERERARARERVCERESAGVPGASLLGRGLRVEGVGCRVEG